MTIGWSRNQGLVIMLIPFNYFRFQMNLVGYCNPKRICDQWQCCDGLFMQGSPATLKWFTSKTNVLVTWSKWLLIIALGFSWRAQTQLGTIKAFRYLRRPDTWATKWWKWCFPFSSPPRSWTCEFPQYFAPINLTPPSYSSYSPQRSLHYVIFIQFI